MTAQGKTAKARTMTTGELDRALRDHYLPPTEMLPGGIYVSEVGINGLASRRCDAIYVGFTSASGRIMVGHELKVSRADWRHELDTRTKADTWSDACHAWYVVAPSVDIVPVEELPPGWGLMVPDPRSKRRFKTLVRSHIKVDHEPPWWAVRSVMARQDTLRGADIMAHTTRRLNEAADDIEAGRRPRHAESRRVHDAVQVAAARRSVERSGDPVATQLVAAFAERGVALVSSRWDRPADSIAPEHLADPDVRAILRDVRDLEIKRKQLTGPYHQRVLQEIAEGAEELLNACRKIAPPPEKRR